MNTSLKKLLLGGLFAGALIGGHAIADYNDLVEKLEAKGVITADEASELAAQTIEPDNKWLDKLELRGRIHVQAAYVDGENDVDSGDWSTIELRRARFGARATFPGKFRGHIEGNILPGEASLRAAYISWRANKPAYITAGYDKPRSSLEENWSSSKILTVERSHVNNTIAAPGETVGVWVNGEIAPFFYHVGIYNDEDATRNTSNEESEYLFNARGGVELALAEGTDLTLAATYLASDDPEGNVGGDYEDITVFSLQAEVGNLGLLTEYMVGAEASGDDTDGFNVMGWVDLSDKWQAVGRFESLSSDAADGIRATSRYGRRTDFVGDADRGDDYSAFYLGLNYYITSHGNKVMFGIEFNELDNTEAGTYETTTLYTAWRTRF